MILDQTSIFNSTFSTLQYNAHRITIKSTNKKPAKSVSPGHRPSLVTIIIYVVYYDLIKYPQIVYHGARNDSPFLL